ncbi:hypothetical protein E2562_002399 [Oryza meyeriana var. granulata]|uniref:Uncharacterized protein n=1 Tax=Oryza meyeriana var. granulata TaxID=110450 RepID=A0A6G1BID5_9ORYZ|nr:hypothetical protein E2562_002399 [Oryza meyeriana var. granulata]
MPISSGVLAPAPAHGPSSASSAVGRKALGVRSPPASVAVAAGGGVRGRRLAGVGVVAASPDEMHARGRPLRGGAYEEKSALWNLIKDIEPLDLSIIQKDVPSETVDAMKRTVSGMLGLLPSNQFHVVIESLWNPFFKLLASSIMTGYTLFNAQYRLSLERMLEFSVEETECQKRDSSEDIHSVISVGRPAVFFSLLEDVGLTLESEMADEKLSGNMDGLGNLSIEAKELIFGMQSRLDSMEKELHELKKKNSSQQMQQFAGEEKNELLYYLRSLSPEKVVELSESSCPGVEEAVHSVVHGLLATLSPKTHTKAPSTSENMAGGAVNFGTEDDDFAELVEDVSLPFQPLISIPRDHLARLLFWCMMLGHYIRGQECRLELTQLLAVLSDAHT